MVILGYIRLVLVLLALVLFFIIGLPVGAFVLIAGKFAPELKERIVYPFVRFGFRMVRLAAGIRVEVTGRELIPADRPCLFIGNHRSFFDIVLGYIELPGRVSPVSKQSVAKVPFLHFWMIQIHSLFLNRDSLEKGLEMVMSACELIKKGNSILIFPEGTRNREEGTMLPFHGGSFKIATRTSAPIVPITFVHTGDILEDHFPWIKGRTIRIIFGEPVETKLIAPKDRKQIPEDCRQKILETYEIYK